VVFATCKFQLMFLGLFMHFFLYIF
jgi:hypothetical protein